MGKKSKAGRPNKYYTHVLPNLEKIEELALTMTEQQIAKTLGIGYTSWKKYKKEYPTIDDHLKKGRTNLVSELKSTLIKKAKGFDYVETETTYEYGKETKKVVKVKYAQPDTGANHLLLKNYDKENWANDPQTLALKREELEIKKKQIEDNNW